MYNLSVHWGQGGSRNMRKGRSLPFPTSPLSSPFPLFLPSPCPLEVRPLNPARGVGQRCKLPSGVRAENEFGALLRLSESHWWQSFWLLWVPCFTVERSKYIDREWRRQSVAQRGRGGAVSPPPSKSTTGGRIVSVALTFPHPFV